jgi:hypothetical protein
MSEATRILIETLIRLAKGMLTAIERWLAAQNASTPSGGQNGKRT